MQIEKEVYYLSKDDKAKLFNYLHYFLLPKSQEFNDYSVQVLAARLEDLNIEDYNHVQYHQIKLFASVVDPLNFERVFNVINLNKLYTNVNEIETVETIKRKRKPSHRLYRI